MSQDELQSDRVARVAQSLSPAFEQTKMELAEAIIAAEDGQVIEQTERVIYDRLNRLKTTTQEIGTQARIQEVESDFFPAGAPAKTLQ